MVEMTIRLDEDATEAIEQLKKHLGEKTANKAILYAIKHYLIAENSARNYKDKYEGSLRKIENIKYAHKQEKYWSEVLRDHIE